MFKVILPSFKINITYIFVFRNEVLCDVRFEADDGKIVIGHKNVLIAASPYFRGMLNNFAERRKGLIKIRELDSTILQLLVDYIYTGEIMVTKENVQVPIIKYLILYRL